MALSEGCGGLPSSKEGATSQAPHPCESSARRPHCSLGPPPLRRGRAGLKKGKPLEPKWQRVHTYTLMYVHTHTNVCLRTRPCMCTHAYTSMHVYVYVDIATCCVDNEHGIRPNPTRPALMHMIIFPAQHNTSPRCPKRPDTWTGGVWAAPSAAPAMQTELRSALLQLSCIRKQWECIIHCCEDANRHRW